MNPNQLSNQYDPTRQLDFLYQLAQMNPGNEQIANMYIGALTDYFNPQGSQYQQQQAEREQSLKEASMLGSIENNPQADQAAMSILSKYYPELQQEQSTKFDPYALFKKSKADELAQYTGGEGSNFDPVNQDMVRQAQILQTLSQLSPEQYQQYSAPVSGAEWWQNLFAKGNNTEAARLNRLGLKY